jgi:hypothetical protein
MATINLVWTPEGSLEANGVCIATVHVSKRGQHWVAYQEPTKKFPWKIPYHCTLEKPVKSFETARNECESYVIEALGEALS